MRLLTLGEVLALHRRILAESGGKPGVRDFGAIASALSQPRVSVGEVRELTLTPNSPFRRAWTSR